MHDQQEQVKRLQEDGVFFLYLQDSFLDYSIRNWRVNVIGQDRHLDKHDVNDIIRLVSILGMNDNRHHLLALVRGKVSTRREIDGAKSKNEMIFDQIGSQFSNKAIVVIPPKEFCTLDSHANMNPNDETRISLKRSGRWLLDL